MEQHLQKHSGRLLRKYSDKIIISYDSDGAGQAATLRGLDILNNLGCDVRILQMEGAKDPDEYVIKYGNAKFNMLVQNAISLVEFKTKMLKKNLDIQNVNDKIKFLKEIAKLLSKIESKIEQELYISKISAEYNISKEAIYAEINKISNKNQTVKLLEKPKPIKTAKAEENISKTDIRRENTILALLLKNGLTLYKKINKKIDASDFKSDINKVIAEKIFKEFENGKENINISELFEDETIISKVSEIMVDDYDLKDEEKALEDIINIYEKEKLINIRNDLIRRIAEGKEENLKELETKLQEIIKKLTPKK